ncbi:Formyl-coenzyme A transferase [Slackia heliotrinireducens]|uniref:Predicted acyl-CoA transferase/carnitine dehydratase n=1 Tax=Slackia heliotrinireducens (strain ATCC 29202 / DSM 20476 / NCTC 11029 / RHS 1) TaxID=471855 RepID=C7N4Y8_SLAHD|nr:CoA transferase [Slackia heliotrinireducens]ACV21973.1 predicted acyl-CoA transferase/carnitine dehydratase [Slackia heliotrinireducens DSM 20476]VEG99844.1 Formyl-coenzyme A transferase [Slackia heliotrinireducens]
MQPLKGLKVVDLTTFLATPTTGRVLGEMGAEVIKVEAAKGDPTRVNQAPVYGMPMADDENLAFDMANMHKRCISLNLKSETGLEAFNKLLADADIFITNNRTKSLRKMGLDWESLHAKYPRLIMGHGLGYGKVGAEKDAAGFDVTCYMGRGGVFGTTVDKDSFPMIPTNGYGDFQASMFLAAGILAAVIGRETTGEGDYVTCALQHAGIYALSTGMVSAQYGNPYPKSRLEVNNPLNNVFRSGDGKWVVLCLPEYNRDWPRVLKLIHREDLLEDTDMADIFTVNGKGLAPQVVRILDEGFAQFTRDELLKMFKENDMPCEPAQTPTDIYEDQNAIENEYIKQVPYPKGGRWCPTIPVQFEINDMAPFEPTGKLGEDTEAVMKELGYTDEQIAAALADGSIKGATSLDELI